MRRIADLPNIMMATLDDRSTEEYIYSMALYLGLFYMKSKVISTESPHYSIENCIVVETTGYVYRKGGSEKFGSNRRLCS